MRDGLARLHGHREPPRPDEIASAVLAELRAAVGSSPVLTDVDAVESYRRDEADWAEFGLPLAVVRPRSTKQALDPRGILNPGKAIG